MRNTVRVGFSVSLPQYVVRRGDMLHFRMKVPSDLRVPLGMQEVTSSLRTNHPREAGKKAQRLAWLTSKAFHDIRRGKYGPMAELDRDRIRQLIISWIREELEGYEIDKATRTKRPTEESCSKEEMNLDCAFDASLEVLLGSQHIRTYRELCMELIEREGLDVPEGSDTFALLCREMAKGVVQLYATMKKRFHEDYSPPLDSVLWFPEVHESALQGMPVPTTQAEEEDHGPLLSQLLEEYHDEKVREGLWKEKTAPNNIAMLRDFVEMVGDKPVGLLIAQDVREAKRITPLIPSNRNKKKQYRGKTIAQLMDMSIPESDRLSLTTVSNRGNKVRSFLLWIRQQGYPILQGLEGIYSFRASNQKAEEFTAVFTVEELQTIFTSSEYVQYITAFPHFYWPPLISLFSGMRVEEICQLYVEDIHEEDGVMCFDMNKKADKSIKSKASRRLVPIHPELIALGFLTYVETVKGMEQERVFSMLKKTKSTRYGETTSRWFTRFREKLCINGDEDAGEKVFHSLRHNFSTQCKYAGVDELMTAETMGHSTGKKMTYGRYGKSYRPAQVMEQLMGRLSYDIDLSHLKARAEEWKKPNSKWIRKEKAPK